MWLTNLPLLRRAENLTLPARLGNLLSAVSSRPEYHLKRIPLQVFIEVLGELPWLGECKQKSRPDG